MRRSILMWDINYMYLVPFDAFDITKMRPTTFSVVAATPSAMSEAPPVQMADPSTRAAAAMSSQMEFFWQAFVEPFCVTAELCLGS